MHEETMTALTVKTLELYNERERIKVLDSQGIVKYTAVKVADQMNKCNPWLLGVGACVAICGLATIATTATGRGSGSIVPTNVSSYL